MLIPGRSPRHRLSLRHLLASALLLPAGITAAQQQGNMNTAQPCSNLPHSDHPKAALRSGGLSAVVFLPDSQTGYYRGSRFDWGGIVGCAALNGHTFFGEWFPRYDPLISDAVTGPAEEFRHPTSEIGYDEAKPGDPFLKIGVGVLRRIDEKPYFFGTSYPIVDGGKWTVKARKNSVTFRQEVHSTFGYAFVYEKTLTLDGKGNVLTLSHTPAQRGAEAAGNRRVQPRLLHARPPAHRAGHGAAPAVRACARQGVARVSTRSTARPFAWSLHRSNARNGAWALTSQGFSPDKVIRLRLHLQKTLEDGCKA